MTQWIITEHNGKVIDMVLFTEGLKEVFASQPDMIPSLASKISALGKLEVNRSDFQSIVKDLAENAKPNVKTLWGSIIQRINSKLPNDSDAIKFSSKEKSVIATELLEALTSNI